MWWLFLLFLPPTMPAVPPTWSNFPWSRVQQHAFHVMKCSTSKKTGSLICIQQDRKEESQCLEKQHTATMPKLFRGGLLMTRWSQTNLFQHQPLMLHLYLNSVYKNRSTIKMLRVQGNFHTTEQDKWCRRYAFDRMINAIFTSLMVGATNVSFTAQMISSIEWVN